MSDNKSLVEKMREPWADLLEQHPQGVKRFWYGGGLVLALLAAADAFVHHHHHFDHALGGYDGKPTFFWVYGFATCVIMVVVSKKVVGLLLQRKDTHYDGD